MTVLVRSAAELAGVVAGNPFVGRAGVDPRTLHVTFLADAPDPDRCTAIEPDAGGADAFEIVGREVYLHCPGGYGRSKLNNAFWERKLKVPATTRNWNSVTRLAAMAAE